MRQAGLKRAMIVNPAGQWTRSSGLRKCRRNVSFLSMAHVPAATCPFDKIPCPIALTREFAGRIRPAIGLRSESGKPTEASPSTRPHRFLPVLSAPTPHGCASVDHAAWGAVTRRCPGCDALPGRSHHPGCDIARCHHTGLKRVSLELFGKEVLPAARGLDGEKWPIMRRGRASEWPSRPDGSSGCESVARLWIRWEWVGDGRSF